MASELETKLEKIADGGMLVMILGFTFAALIGWGLGALTFNHGIGPHITKGA